MHDIGQYGGKCIYIDFKILVECRLNYFCVVIFGPFLLLPWSCGADASVLGRCGDVLWLTVVDSGAVVVDWAFVWCEWCRLVVVEVCELQKSARARAEGLEGGWSADS